MDNELKQEIIDTVSRRCEDDLSNLNLTNLISITINTIGISKKQIIIPTQEDYKDIMKEVRKNKTLVE